MLPERHCAEAFNVGIGLAIDIAIDLVVKAIPEIQQRTGPKIAPIVLLTYPSSLRKSL